MFRVATDSPLRRPPHPISERQIIFLDGIRYSADMAGLAIDRLWRQLCVIDSTEGDIETHQIAEAALDAWSIIDAAHRMSDLIENLPGLPNANWRRVFKDRITDALTLRNTWQHQGNESARTVEQRGQAWGALAWAQHHGDRPTGHWFLAVVGSGLKGGQWLHAGPARAIPRVDARRIRLLHAGKTIYLTRIVGDMFEALRHLEQDVSDGRLRLTGTAVDQRPSDWVLSQRIEVLMAFRDRAPGG